MFPNGRCSQDVTLHVCERDRRQYICVPTVRPCLDDSLIHHLHSPYQIFHLAFNQSLIQIRITTLSANMVYIATVLSGLLIGFAAGQSYIHPTVPANADVGVDVSCDSIGDCRTANVKWGHPSPNNTAYAQDIPQAARSTIPGLLKQAIDHANASIVDDTNVDTISENGPVTLTLQAFTPGAAIKWRDVYEYWQILLNSANNITKIMDGIIWDKNDPSKQVGYWATHLVVPATGPGTG